MNANFIDAALDGELEGVVATELSNNGPVYIDMKGELVYLHGTNRQHVILLANEADRLTDQLLARRAARKGKQ